MMTPKLPVLAWSSPDEAEQQFYESMQRADLERFMAVWSDDDEIICIHPGGPRLIGVGLIRESFGAIFAKGPLEVHPEKIRRVDAHFSAVHSVIERVQVQTDAGRQTVFVLATNVYMKTALGWRLVAHHASPGTPRESQEVLESTAVLH